MDIEYKPIPEDLTTLSNKETVRCLQEECFDSCAETALEKKIVAEILKRMEGKR